MKMKQLLFGSLLFAAFSATALQSQAQVEVGVRAGLNLSNVAGKDADGNKAYKDSKLNPGFHAGLTFDIPVADEFYVQPGALFSTKGYKYDFSRSDTRYESKTTPYYIEVPVNFLYKPTLGEGKLLLGAGPYVAYGLGGKWKAEGSGSLIGTDVYTSGDGNLEFVNDFEDRSNNKQVYGKPFDFGANLLAGYEFSNKFSAQLNGQLGLANLRPNTNGDKPESTFKNVGFGVSVGYKF